MAEGMNSGFCNRVTGNTGFPAFATVCGNHPTVHESLAQITEPGAIVAVNFACSHIQHTLVCTHHWEMANKIRAAALPGGLLVAPNNWPGVDVVWPNHTKKLGATGGSGLYAILVACELFDRVNVCGIELDCTWSDYTAYRHAFRLAWQRDFLGIRSKLVVPVTWEWLQV